MAAHGFQASSSLTNPGDPPLFGDDDFNWIMNAIPMDGEPAMDAASRYLNEVPLPAPQPQPQHVARTNEVLSPATRAPPPPPSVRTPFSVWTSDPKADPVLQLDEAVEALTRAQNKIIDLEIQLESLKKQKSQADDRLATLLTGMESLLNNVNRDRRLSTIGRVRSRLPSTGN